MITGRVGSVRRLSIYLLLAIFPSTLHASFIESTMGTAVVNDATATYHNPAALILVKNPQIIGLGSVAQLQTQFSGQALQPTTGFVQTGSATTHKYYYLPSFYLGLPASDKMTLGFAIISNFFSSDAEDNSLLRYVQSNSNVSAVDFIPSVGFKINQFFSVGAGANFSYADFRLQPISGLPGLNIPDSLSRNDSDGSGVGGTIGFLLKPAPATLIGFSYRTSVTYHLSGTSTFEGNPTLTSNAYKFTFWTPARSILSISQFLTPKVGLIATAQRIDWSIFKTVYIQGIATQVGTQSVVINATVPYYLHDTWLLTLGGNYQLNPKWIVRIAGSYNQSPGNPNYQIANGDSIILGISSGYEISKDILIDGSYAHAFIHDENIHTNGRFIINGINKGYRDAISLKLTWNL